MTRMFEAEDARAPADDTGGHIIGHAPMLLHGSHRANLCTRTSQCHTDLDEYGHLYVHSHSNIHLDRIHNSEPHTQPHRFSDSFRDAELNLHPNIKCYGYADGECHTFRDADLHGKRDQHAAVSWAMRSSSRRAGQ